MLCSFVSQGWGTLSGSPSTVVAGADPPTPRTAIYVNTKESFLLLGRRVDGVWKMRGHP